MSSVSTFGQDRIVLLDSVPNPAAGSTEPFIVADERQVAVIYRIANSDFERYGPFDEENEPFCLLQFSWAAFHRLGPPNDEGLGAHPLASRGLKWYSVHEVMDSSLVAEHWPRVPAHYPRRHFVLTFQDSTFECVAANCSLIGVFSSADIAGREAFLLYR